MSALPQSARAILPQCRPRSWFNAQFLLLRTWCGAPVQWTSLAWLTQSSMELSQQVRDPLGNRFGNLGIRREFAGNGCLNFFDDQVLTRRSQGFSCAVSMGHLGSPVRVGYRTQRSMMYFRSTLGVEMQSMPGDFTTIGGPYDPDDPVGLRASQLRDVSLPGQRARLRHNWPTSNRRANTTAFMRR